jgi:hypothetical protein
VRFVSSAPWEVAQSLESLVTDRDAWSAAGEAVQNHARRTFAWDQAAERYELLYEELLAGRRSRGLQTQLPSNLAAPDGGEPTAAYER